MTTFDQQGQSVHGTQFNIGTLIVNNIRAVRFDYAQRINNFLADFLGTPE